MLISCSNHTLTHIPFHPIGKEGNNSSPPQIQNKSAFINDWSSYISIEGKVIVVFSHFYGAGAILLPLFLPCAKSSGALEGIPDFQEMFLSIYQLTAHFPLNLSTSCVPSGSLWKHSYSCL